MSTVAHVKGLRGPDGRAEEGVLCLVKGSPEVVGPFARPPTAAPASPRGTTRPTRRSPSRASACWRWRTSGARGRRRNDAREVAARPREVGRVEPALLRASWPLAAPGAQGLTSRDRGAARVGHQTIMLTGDAPPHRAARRRRGGDDARSRRRPRPVGRRRRRRRPGEGDDPLHGSGGGGGGDVALAAGCGAARRRSRVAADGEGVGRRAAEAHPELWGAAWHMAEVVVYARMSPEGKERGPSAARAGAHTLMCGDGGNDVVRPGRPTLASRCSLGLGMRTLTRRVPRQRQRGRRRAPRPKRRSKSRPRRWR